MRSELYKINQENRKIDMFRMVAAFFIVAIHTAPFESVNKTLDYLFTYCIGRIGVPFFLMVTGYFVLAPYYQNKENSVEKLKKYLIKILALYGISILLYLPVNIYAGQLPDSFGIFWKELLIDGTFYHLWYLPATVTGCLFLIILMKLLGNKGTGIAALILYVIGLFGDSYYGMIEEIPVLKSVYDGIFTVSSYTRNGIFYVPIFLWMGIQFAGKNKFCMKNSQRTAAVGLGISLALMLVEGFLTWNFELQRHNSMYLFLLPVMYFLFLLLVRENLSKDRQNHLYNEADCSHDEVSAGKHNYKNLRNISLWIYMLHPLCIIVIRGFAKAADILIIAENSLIHYFLVCILSTIGAAIINQLLNIGRRKLSCIRRAGRGLN